MSTAAALALLRLVVLELVVLQQHPTTIITMLHQLVVIVTALVEAAACLTSLLPTQRCKLVAAAVRPVSLHLDQSPQPTVEVTVVPRRQRQQRLQQQLSGVLPSRPLQRHLELMLPVRRKPVSLQAQARRPLQRPRASQRMVAIIVVMVTAVYLRLATATLRRLHLQRTSAPMRQLQRQLLQGYQQLQVTLLAHHPTLALAATVTVTAM